MIKCEKVKKLLAYYSLGAFSQNRRMTIEAHLNRCPNCQKELRALEQIGELMNLIPIESAPDPELSWSYIEDRISQQQKDQENRAISRLNILSWVKFYPALRFASILLFLLSVGTTLFVMTNFSPVLEPIANQPMIGAYVSESYLYTSWREPFAQKGNVAAEIEKWNR